MLYFPCGLNICLASLLATHQFFPPTQAHLFWSSLSLCFFLYQHILTCIFSNVWSRYFLLFPSRPPPYFSLCANMHFPWPFLRLSQMKLKLIAFLISWNIVYCVPMCIWLYGCALVQLYSDLITVTHVRGCWSWMFSHFVFSINMLFDCCKALLWCLLDLFSCLP